MSPANFVERAELWELPLIGAVVSRCIYDYAFTLVLGETPPFFDVRIENSFTLRRGAEVSAVLDPGGEPDKMAESLRLLRTSVTRAVAFKDGRLEIDFDDGQHLSARPDGEYESWQITGPDGARMVANTAGELVVWS